MPGGPIVAAPQYPPWIGLPIFNQYHDFNVDPHPSTVRWNYTVPTNRALLVTAAVAMVLRDGVPGVPGRAWSQVAINLGGDFAFAVINSGEVGKQDRSEFGQATILVAGQNVHGKTTDGDSVDGTHEYICNLYGIEYTPA